jgi:hypothetical protein
LTGFCGPERRLFFANHHPEIAVFDGLHPRMPQKSVFRAVAFRWDGDVGGRNETVSGKFLHELDHVAARNVEFRREMVERRPSVALAAREVSQVRVQLLRLVGNLLINSQPEVAEVEIEG